MMARAVSPGSDEWKVLLLKQRVQLLESVSFRGTLLWDHLLQNEVITPHQYQYGSHEGRADIDMCRYVLDHIKFKPQFDGFVKSLQDSGQEHVADLLKGHSTPLRERTFAPQGPDDLIAAPITKMQALSLNDVTVTLVAPWCDKGILQDAGVICEETSFKANKQTNSSKSQGLENMLAFVLHMTQKFSTCIFSKESSVVTFTLNHLITGEDVEEDTLEDLLDVLTEKPSSIIYFACKMARPINSHRRIADKFSKLVELSSVFTDATYNNLNESMNYPAHECIAVGNERPADGSSPWGGLLDMVVRKVRVQGRDKAGRNYMVTCGSCPAAYAVATSIGILGSSPTLGIPAPDITLLQSTRTMRRVLISLCDSDTPGHHQPLAGYGTLKPEPLMKDQTKLKRIITEHIDYWRNIQRSTHPAIKVSDFVF